MSITGERDGEPTKVGVALLDVITGLYAAIGIQAALVERARTGRGRHVSVSLFDASVAALVNQAANHLLGGVVPGPLGSEHPEHRSVPGVPRQRPAVHPCGRQRQAVPATCEVLGRPDLADDERFATNDARVAHRDVADPPAPRGVRRADGRGAGSRRLEAAGVPVRADPAARRGVRLAGGRGRRADACTTPAAGRSGSWPTRSARRRRAGRAAPAAAGRRAHRGDPAGAGRMIASIRERRRAGRCAVSALDRWRGSARGVADPGGDPGGGAGVAVGVPDRSCSGGGRRAVERRRRAGADGAAGGGGAPRRGLDPRRGLRRRRDVAPARRPRGARGRRGRPGRHAGGVPGGRARRPAWRRRRSRAPGRRSRPEAEAADVVVCGHVLYNVADAGPFVRRAHAHARRRVVLEITGAHPLVWMSDLWLRFHGLERPSGPTADDATRRSGRPASSRTARSAPPTPIAAGGFERREDAVALVRRRLCLPAARDAEIEAALGDRLREHDGLWSAGPPGRRLVTLWWDIARRPEPIGRDAPAHAARARATRGSSERYRPRPCSSTRSRLDRGRGRVLASPVARPSRRPAPSSKTVGAKPP